MPVRRPAPPPDVQQCYTAAGRAVRRRPVSRQSRSGTPRACVTNVEWGVVERMAQDDGSGCFTIGVFADASWASRGLEALARDGFEPEMLSIVAKESPETMALVERTFGAPPDDGEVDVHRLGRVLAHGSLVSALQGADEGLVRVGLAATIRRAGFQAHDGFIFETLTARGGVLVGIDSEPRAADALALLHAYGGGNAAIGAWTGRV